MLIDQASNVTGINVIIFTFTEIAILIVVTVIRESGANRRKNGL